MTGWLGRTMRRREDDVDGSIGGVGDDECRWSVDLIADVGAEHDLGELTCHRFFARSTQLHFRSTLRLPRHHGLAYRSSVSEGQPLSRTAVPG